MTTVVNLINEVFGTKGTSDYPRLAASISRGQVDAGVSNLLDTWRQWATDWTPPEAKPHAIRPLSLVQRWVYTTTRTRPARLPHALSWPGYLQEFHDGRYGRRYFRGCRRWPFLTMVTEHKLSKGVRRIAQWVCRAVCVPSVDP